jgi:hypothetical protein
MRRGQIITHKQTTAASFSVQGELHTIGLWYEDCKLLKVEVFWCLLPQITMYDALGFFTHGASTLDWLLGYEPGHIYIPAFVLSHFFWQSRGSLRDVIRHEYAHALAHYYPNLICNSKEFEKAFGGKYYSYEPCQMEREAFVSEYAKTMPMEDFAETFMVFVRRKGFMPSNILNAKLKRKWKFIAKIIKQV